MKVLLKITLLMLAALPLSLYAQTKFGSTIQYELRDIKMKTTPGVGCQDYLSYYAFEEKWLKELDKFKDQAGNYAPISSEERSAAGLRALSKMQGKCSILTPEQAQREYIVGSVLCMKAGCSGKQGEEAFVTYWITDGDGKLFIQLISLDDIRKLFAQSERGKNYKID